MGLNGLESLYGLDMRRSEEMTAKDIMETDLKVVPCQTTVRVRLHVPAARHASHEQYSSQPASLSINSSPACVLGIPRITQEEAASRTFLASLSPLL